MDVKQRCSSGWQPATGPTERFRILVMGPTGAGKSSFVAAASNDHVDVGQGTESCTRICKSYPVKYAVGEPVKMLFDLVDTPGFDDPDPTMNDFETLTEIANYAVGAWGVIYVHPITESRLTGSARLNVEVLKAMCGEDFYPRVVVCTTMWNNQPQARMHNFQERLDDLLRDDRPIGDLVRGGARHMAFWEGSGDPCRAILDHFASLYPKMAILRNLKEPNQGVHETHAGKVLTEEQDRQRQRARRTSNVLVERTSKAETQLRYGEHKEQAGDVEVPGSNTRHKWGRLVRGIMNWEPRQGPTDERPPFDYM